MALRDIRNEINRFLSNDTPEVLCIKGKWGVGKTFAWNTYLKEAHPKGGVKLTKYAYTSLFGIKDLNDLKYSIFENTIPLKDLEKEINVDDFSEKLNYVQRNFKKIASVVTSNNFVQQYIGGSSRAMFYFVRKQIVCIDDFERAGGGIEPIEILGLISFLKEQRQCKVIFLLNDEELKDEVKKTFEKQLEKVSDAVLNFSPNPSEAADITYPEPRADVPKLLHDFSVQLGLVNIRVIKKIEKLVNRLLEITGEKYPKLTNQIVHSITLFGWSLYQPTDAPPLEYYKNGTKMMGLLHGNDKLRPEEEKWNTRIRSYNFLICDEFDLAIMEGVKNGYFDDEKILVEAEKANSVILKQEHDNSFTEAWHKYHYSFKDNESEVLDSIYNSGCATVDSISPLNLNSAIKFLKEFDRNAQAKNLLDKFIAFHSENKEIFDIGHRSVFFGEEIDVDIREAFEKKLATFTENLEISSILAEVGNKKGWSVEEIAFIARTSEDDFYNLFKETEGEQLGKIMRGALIFKDIGNPSDDIKIINKNVIAALRRIGSENRFNLRRVKNYGIQLIDDIPSQDEV
jgi:hypothetical protein